MKRGSLHRELEDSRPVGTSTPLRRVLVGGGWEAEQRHADIVLGYGRPGESEPALEVAADLARRLHAHLHVVHVINLADYPIDPDSSEWESAARAAVTREHQEVRAALDGHLTGWSYYAAHGVPANLLASVANEYDALMIVVGSRGEGLTRTLGRLMGGSVADGLIHYCGRPVLVVAHPHSVRTHRHSPAKEAPSD